jgi:hypothetical protein
MKNDGDSVAAREDHVKNDGAGPAERRAIALVARGAERNGIVAPPPELAFAVAQLPYTSDEIDQAFDLFVSDSGRTIGGTLALSDIDSAWLQQLVAAGLVSRLHRPRFTEKGARLNALFSQYADGANVWRSLIFEQQDKSRRKA